VRADERRRGRRRPTHRLVDGATSFHLPSLP
jgi:hypothetical protein